MNIKKIFYKIINEDSTYSGDSGVFGSFEEYGGAVGNYDFYAPNDSRNPFGILYSKNNFNKKNKKKRKKIKNKEKTNNYNNILIPILKRPLFKESEKKELYPYAILIKRNYEWEKVKTIYAYSEKQAIKKFLILDPSYEIYEITAVFDDEEYDRIQNIKKRKEERIKNMWWNKDD